MQSSSGQYIRIQQQNQMSFLRDKKILKTTKRAPKGQTNIVNAMKDTIS